MGLDQIMFDSVALPNFLYFCYTDYQLLVPNNLCTWKASWTDGDVFKLMLFIF